MKKKGLLISTIVMVVVLVASLTTATYAWFSATAEVKIDSMSLSTKATEGLIIGAKGADSDGHSYYNGALTWADNQWTGGTLGLGSNVSFMVDGTSTGVYGLDVTRACTPWSPSGAAIASGAGITGSGAYVSAYSVNGDSSRPDTSKSGATGVEISKKNIDYIDLEVGLSASSNSSVKQAFCTITFKNLNAADLYMTGALHLIVKLDGQTGLANKETIIGDVALGQDLFTGAASTTNTIGQLKDDNTTLEIAFYIFKYDPDLPDTDASKYMGADQIDPAVTVEILAWFEGYDSSCLNENTGLGNCQMDIAFAYDGVTVEDGDLTTISSSFVKA